MYTLFLGLLIIFSRMMAKGGGWREVRLGKRVHIGGV